MPYPCKEEYFEPIEWPHILSTLDVCVNPKSIKFCTPKGYDIQPFFMITQTYRSMDNHSIEPQFYCQDQVSVEDLPLTIDESTKDGDQENYSKSSDDDGKNDFNVPEFKLEKVQLLLKGREAVTLNIPKNQPRQESGKSHRKFCKQALRLRKD